MKIKLNSDVSTAFTKTAKGGYSTATVEYTNDRNENKSWKLISFANPAVFDLLKTGKTGEYYEVTLGKNDKDFTTWAEAKKVTDDTPPVVKAAASMNAPQRSTYETPEERAVKQRLIVRQSSLAQAITFYNKSTDDTDQLLELAEKFAAWVYEEVDVDLFNQENDLTGA